MIKMGNVLGSLLQAGMTRSGGRRVEHAIGRDGQGGALGGLLGQLKGGSPAAIGGLGALAGAVLGAGKGSAMRGAVGGGALALLGTLALDALRKASAGTATPAGPEAVTARLPQSAVVDEGHATLLLRAMINAAKADGQIDGKEMDRIMTRLDEAGEDREARDFVLTELRRPSDVEGLVAAVSTEEQAAEVYAASLLAIEVDTSAEQTYLRDLARRLKLSPAVVGHLHAQLGVSQQA